MNNNIIILLITAAAMVMTVCFAYDTEDDSPFGLCRHRCWGEFLNCIRNCPRVNRKNISKAKAKCHKKLETCNNRCRRRFG
ncbi:hypothetical protein LSAT2_001518 [Lamellibrachia satsuma]|nr:hypothetical protein LSAT2_001518 [Lamellibrachia satsuma]